MTGFRGKAVLTVAIVGTLLFPAQALGEQTQDVHFSTLVEPFPMGGKAIPMSDPSVITSGQMEFSQQTNLVDCSADIGKGICAEANIDSADLQMPVCESPLEGFCIEGLEFIFPDGRVQSSETIKSLDQNGTPPIKSLSLPKGGASSLWAAPADFAAQGVDGFYVSVRERFLRYSRADKFHQFSTSATVIPYTAVNDKAQIPKKYILGYAFGNSPVPSDGNAFVTCPKPGTVVWSDFGACGVKAEYPDGLKIRLKFRENIQSSNWFHGRLGDPLIESKLVGDYRSLSITGEALKIPLIIGTIPKSDWLNSVGKKLVVDPEANLGINILLQDSYANANSWIELLMPYASDRASSEESIWTVSSQPLNVGFQLGHTADCIANHKGFAGIVVSNSTVYNYGPPTLNSSTQTIDYAVMAPHFAEDGSTENLGKYTFIINDAVARCIYGFTKAPIKASISVHTSSGEVKVATTAMELKGDWLKFSASSYTYSAPVISVRLTQDKVSATGTSNTKKVVTCVRLKNKKIKRTVTGTNPKCPKGFKVKR